MAITQVSNNVILDGTILPAKLNVSANMRTFLGNATSANLASAVSGTTGSGNLVFAISPNLTNPTISGVAAISGTNSTGVITATTTSNSVSISVASLLAANATGDTYFSVGRALSTNNSALVGHSTVGGGNYAFVTVFGRPASDFAVTSNGNVGFGTSTPNASARVQIDSTTQGLLPPRMTVAQRNAIASVAEGLVVYSTDAGVKTLSLHNGTAWGNVLTTHSDSFTSDTLAAALSDESGTGGGFTRAVGATHTTPTLSGHSLTATSKYKGSDTTRSSNTFASDSDLTIPLAANANYTIEVWLTGSVASAGGSLAIRAFYSGTLDPAITVGEIASVNYGSALNAAVYTWAAVSPPQVNMFESSTTNPRGNVFRFNLKTANAGDFEIRWSNGNGAGTGSGSYTLHQGCSITATRITP